MGVAFKSGRIGYAKLTLHPLPSTISWICPSVYSGTDIISVARVSEEPFFLSVAVVGFLEQFVNVSESDGQALLEIGVISGTLQRDLVLQLLLIPGTAQGA